MNSSNIAVKVENISKLYRIGIKEQIHDSMVSAIFDFIKSPLTNYRKYRSLYNFDDINPNHNQNPKNANSDIIWAVKEVSFNVNKGEVLGIIGRNGAGKSTLLKILCRIVDPTKGYAEILGRVSSLLEVGTGFHQELTGRENIYLNGTILGMTKKEVENKFDQIVDFSGIGKFIDTPVKRYSSGMKVRLAFSVAAHLEPEILIIDEVLAVGDAEFQKKCLNKMEEVGKGGRTVIFVSHNMPAVSKLCHRAVLLENGKMVSDGPTNEVIKSYLASNTACSAFRNWDENTAPRGKDVILRSVKVHDENNNVMPTVNIRDSFFITMEYEVITHDLVLLPHFHFFNGEGTHAFVTLDKDTNWYDKRRPKGYYTSTVKVEGNLLSEGIYYIHCNMLSLHPVATQFSFQDAVIFHVYDDGKGNTAIHKGYPFNLPGVVRPFLEWSTRKH